MTARLSYERIAHGGATPERWLFVTHGIYGSGKNFRSFARKLVENRSEWGVVLLDLRHHGASETGEPPFTLAACADDVAALVESMRGTDTIALSGHSFGGKVMLAVRSRVQVVQTWVLDATPSADPGGLDQPNNLVARVLRSFERIPRQFAHRHEFHAAMKADGAYDGPLLEWLAMNLAQVEGGFRFQLDPVVLRAMLESYYATDLWADAADATRGRLDVVIAGRSTVFDAAARERLATLGPHVHTHVVDAGHWLQVDAPAATVELFVTDLP